MLMLLCHLDHLDVNGEMFANMFTISTLEADVFKVVFTAGSTAIRKPKISSALKRAVIKTTLVTKF